MFAPIFLKTLEKIAYNFAHAENARMLQDLSLVNPGASETETVGREKM